MEAALVLPVLVFVAKVAELTVSTSRTILVVSGMSLQAAALGFAEITIGIVAVGAVVTHLDDPFTILGYSAGFAVGIIAGGWVEERLALGYRTVHIVNTDQGVDLARLIRQRGYAVTRMEGTGREGPVEIGLAVVQRRSLPGLLAAIAAVAPTSFVTVERAERPIRGTFMADRPWWDGGIARR